MSAIEADRFTPCAEFEKAWLQRYVEAGIFSRSLLPALQAVHDQILSDPQAYLREVSRFERQICQGIPIPADIPSGVRVLGPIVYVARWVVSKPEPGVGLNIVFSPSDPAYHEVAKELYPRTVTALELAEHTLPFGVLWADAYYFQGSAYHCGEIEGSGEESGYEVFHGWEQTWAALHTEAAVFFRLDPPYRPNLVA